MSWDVSLYKFDQIYSSLADIPSEESAMCPIGSTSEVKAAIDKVFSGTNWNEPQKWGIWGTWISDLGSVEFDIGCDDPVKTVALHVRAKDKIISGILELTKNLACQAIDVDEGVFLTDNSANGMEKWCVYRNLIINQYKTPHD